MPVEGDEEVTAEGSTSEHDDAGSADSTPSSGSTGGSSEDAEDSTGDDSADGDDGSTTEDSEETTGCTDCPPLSWPTSAEEALNRSEYWDPAAQQLHEGTIQSMEHGQIIEDLHIVDGELIIEHDDVIVRNVTVEGLVNEDAGNFPVELLGDAQNVQLEGIYMGPPQQGWDPMCDMPMFPASGFRASGNATWTMRASATRHTGDAIKANGGQGTFEDCFLEVAMGIWAVGTCENDHTDILQISNGSPTLEFRRVWMDALRYVAPDPDGPIVQAETPGGATGLQLGGEASATLVYDTVRLHSGNFSMRIFGDTTLSIIDSVSIDPTHGPILTGDDTVLTIEQWSGNTLGDGTEWEPPS